MSKVCYALNSVDLCHFNLLEQKNELTSSGKKLCQLQLETESDKKYTELFKLTLKCHDCIRLAVMWSIELKGMK